MSTARLTVRDLIEEAKKRILLLVICVVGLSYLMSLTSASVWVNMPAAASLIVLLRYISLDIEMKRRAAAYSDKPSSANQLSQKKPPEVPKVSLEKSNWRRKVNSPVVEAAIDKFTRHLVSEWVTDLWYSRLTPDRDVPEELVQIINGVLGEVSCRVKEINLIDLLTRDVIRLICTHLELFRTSQAKIIRQQFEEPIIDHRDRELKQIMAADNKLHPALFSAEAEHKVLQHLMDGLISFSFKPEDLQCSFFRYIARELLACTVIRPILNLASPRFINERIESLVLSTNKADKGVTTSPQDASQPKPNGPSRISSDHQSVRGVELMQFKREDSKTASGESVKKSMNGISHLKDPLLSIDAQSSRSWNSLPSDPKTDDRKDIQQHRSGGEWGEMLDMMCHRKTRALAPEHFENMWTKGRNYKKKEGANQLAKQITENLPAGIPVTLDHSNLSSKHQIKDGTTKFDISQRKTSLPPHAHTDGNRAVHPPATSHQGELEDDQMFLEDFESESSSCYTEEEEEEEEAKEEESSSVTGFDSPGTKVWDGKNNRNASVSFIHHPLENSGGRMVRKTGKARLLDQRLSRTQPGRKRSRLGNKKVNTWQEVERSTFRQGDGQDILKPFKEDAKAEDSSDDPELESGGRVHSGAAASSSAPSISITEACNSSINSLENSVLADSFLKLRCEVLGANIVKSGSRTFAVYSVSVTDVNNNSWSIKRRFRHFEELHRRLKEYPQYNLNLPPKHFLSTGLEISVVQERCKFLDKYLKRLLQLPTISGSIEVWDFLSVDSQTYMFSNSFSIIETLSVNLDNKSYEKSTKDQNLVAAVNGPLLNRGEHLNINRKETTLQIKQSVVAENPGLRGSSKSCLPVKISGEKHENHMEASGSDSNGRLQRSDRYIRKSEISRKERGSENPQETSEVFLDAATDPTLPTEWIPPNLSVPILDLVDVIFQLHDGGWIRKQAFWVAKQVLQLGMGDAFDDWLIEKIQLLRRGSVIASAIKRVEQILWPDGIFITKHPKRQRPPPSVVQSQTMQISSPKEEGVPTDEQQLQEAARRAKLVYELMTDKAPAALVGLVGHKEYEQCAKDLYFFLQSTVCMKQLAFDLLELLLLSTFPELQDVVKQVHEDKQKFAQLQLN
ncbi:hypothetical protein NE237_025320 [Protea cynaroides]|uniref:Uncharacterized protein n=1 Tax=Protea cynaroides TaxID=273540 RepID=A0A9Q0H6U8_9MAGN|nr:hypothetical protein NE237_025320 [Protea cynaroides]